MTPEQVQQIFIKRNALLKGHFKLSSGLHSDSYMQCALVLQYAEDGDPIGQALADLLKKEKPAVVVSPALGGVVLGYVAARGLKVPALFAERQEGGFALRRGFQLSKSDRVAVVEDVLTTGKSVKEVMTLVESLGAKAVAVGSIVDRSNGSLNFGVPYYSLLKLPLVTYPPESCPLCKSGQPVLKPGSRPENK